MVKITTFIIFILSVGLLRAQQTNTKPNIILILADDLGWKDTGCYGRSPLEQGFDYAVGFNIAGQPGSCFYPYKDTGNGFSGKRKMNPGLDVKGLEVGKQGEYLTDRLTEETIGFIEKHKEAPFFVYLSQYAVHTPLEAKEGYIEHFRKKNEMSGGKASAELKEIKGRAHWRINRSNPVFAAMIKSLDENLGRLLDKLVDFELNDNTIIIFTSDNGSLSTLKRAEQISQPQIYR